MTHRHAQSEEILDPVAWVGGWVTPAMVVGFTLFWSLFIYLTIGNRPPVWNYGVVPYVPGESLFSTESPTEKDVPRQVVLPNPEPRDGQ